MSSLDDAVKTISGSVVPLNKTKTPLDTTPNVSLSASTANTIAIPDGTSKIEIIPDVIPAAPIYIKWSFAAATGTDATATTYDQKLCECKPFAEFTTGNNCSHISLFTTTSCTVSIIYV